MPVAAIDNVKLHYTLEGAENAPVVAFSNSLGTTQAMWRRQASALMSQFRVLTYDTRGHGQSQVLDEPVDMAGLAQDFVGLLDYLGIARAHFVGLSLGGMTGQALAAADPARLSSMVLIATSAFMGAADAWRARAELVRTEGMKAVAQAVLERWFTQSCLKNPPPFVAELEEQLLKTDPFGYAACCSAIARMDLRKSNRSISTPTLVISGAEDPATPPAMGEEIARSIPAAQFRVLSGAAHLPAVERAEDTTRLVLDFIRGHLSASS